MGEVSVNRITISNELLQPSSFPLAIATSSYDFFCLESCLVQLTRHFFSVFNYLNVSFGLFLTTWRYALVIYTDYMIPMTFTNSTSGQIGWHLDCIALHRSLLKKGIFSLLHYIYSCNIGHIYDVHLIPVHLI